MNKLLIFVVGFVLSAKAHALYTSVKIDGTACSKQIRGAHQVSTGTSEYLTLPLRVYVEKDNGGEAISRSCTFELPIQAAPGKKVIVGSSYALANTHVYSFDTKAEVALTISKLNGSGEVSSFSYERDRDEDEGVRMSMVLGPDTVVETSCGGSEVIVGEFKAEVSGKGKASIYTHPLQLYIQEVPCQ